MECSDINGCFHKIISVNYEEFARHGRLEMALRITSFGRIFFTIMFVPVK